MAAATTLLLGTNGVFALPVSAAPAFTGALVLGAPVATAAPPVDVFTLHSDPDSTHTIYLDFVGATVTDTVWNGSGPNGTGQAEIDVPPIDIDRDPTTWSLREQSFIFEVWREVSEYYAIFDVDVTTEQPSAADLGRSSTSDDTYGSTVVIADDPDIRTLVLGDSAPAGMNGIALVGRFGYPSYEPAWVFPQIGHYDPPSVAKVITHEVGHRLGLLHDFSKDDFADDSVWGAIMGYRMSPLSQFTEDGKTIDYTTDEIQWIGDAAHDPLAFRADDYGDTIATADDLGTQPEYSLTGLIGKHVDAPHKDVDVFRVPHQCAADLTASATNSGLGSSLDIRVDIMDSDGNQVVSADPPPAVAPDSPARITGLDASATLAAAPAGDYYIRVSGTGYGEPDNGGYTDYGSIGTYTLDISGCPQQTLVTVTTSVPTTTTATATATVTATTTAPASPAPTVTVTNRATVTNTVTASGSTVTTTAPGDIVTVTAPGGIATVTTTATVTRHGAAFAGDDPTSPSPQTRTVQANSGNTGDSGSGSGPSAAVDQLALTGTPTWTLPLVGYGLLLLTAGAFLMLFRGRRSGRHTA